MKRLSSTSVLEQLLQWHESAVASWGVAVIDSANPVVIFDGLFIEFVGAFIEFVGPFIENVCPFIEFVGLFIENAGPFIDIVGPFIENVGPFIENVGLFIENVDPFIDIVGLFIDIVGPFAISTVATAAFAPLTTGNQHQRSAKPQTNCPSLSSTLDSPRNTT